MWQLDKHFRPSRMVLEQVGWRLVLLKPVFGLMHCSLPVQSCGLPCAQFYATADYKEFSDALTALLQLEPLQCAPAACLWCQPHLYREMSIQPVPVPACLPASVSLHVR